MTSYVAYLKSTLKTPKGGAFRAKRGKNRYIVPIFFAPYPECPTVFCRDATRRVFLLGIKGIKGIKARRYAIRVASQTGYPNPVPTGFYLL